MIKKIIASERYNSNFIFTDFFENQSINIALLLHHTKDGDFYKKLNNDILQGILNLRLDNVALDKIEDILKEYFITLNWQINSKLKRILKEQDGISLLLLVIVNNHLFMVQFGRLLVAISENEKLLEFGRSWEHFKVKNRKELNLLGYEDKDIAVKVYKKKLSGYNRILAVSSEVVEKIDLKNLDISKTADYLKYLTKDQKFLYLLFDIICHKELIKEKTILRKRIKITLFIMIFLILLSTSYVYFGKNWLQNKQEELKEKNSEYIRNDLMQKLLDTQNQLQDVVDQIFSGKLEIKIFSDKKLRLKKKLFIKLNHPVTAIPLFDIKNIYLIQKNRIKAINKLTKKHQWERTFKSRIITSELIDANRMIIATQDSLYCIKRKDGENLWVNDDVSTLRNKKNLSDLHFALNEFNQLDSGVIISVRDNKITFLSNISGEEVASYEFDEKIKFVSDYDKIFKCLYVITDKKVIKLRIIVEI
jgi:hypothetical protein